MNEVLSAALHAARILEGSLDTDIVPTLSSLAAKGKQKSSEDDEGSSVLNQKLSQRLDAWHSACKHATDRIPAQGVLEENLDACSSAQERTGWAALISVLRIQYLIQSVKSLSTSTASSSSAPPPPLLGSRDLKLIGTLIVLIDQWLLASLRQDFDEWYADLTPEIFSASVQNTSKPSSSVIDEINASSRFTELPSEGEAANVRRQRTATILARTHQFVTVCNQIASVLDVGSLFSETPIKESLSSTNTSIPLRQMFIVLTSVNQTALGIRLAFLPKPVRHSSSLYSIHQKDMQQRAGQDLKMLLKGMSTLSALNSLSSAARPTQSPSNSGGSQQSGPSRDVPEYVASVSRSLSSAQLLREDGVRALLHATFGNADDGDGSVVDSEHMDLTTKLERFASLLMTAPKGLPAEVFARNIINQVFAIYAETIGTIRQPASPLHIRALAFFLVRLSVSAQAALLKTTLQERCYSAFSPRPPDYNSVVGLSLVVTPYDKLQQSIDMLSLLLESAEPSPTFVSFLVSPIVPQLLSLQSFLVEGTQVAVQPVKSPEDPRARLTDGVKTLLHTWIRLVDASEAIDFLGTSSSGYLTRGRRGIGEDRVVGKVEEEEDGELYYSWITADEASFGGICVRFGSRPSSQGDLSSLLFPLSIRATDGAAAETPDYSALGPLLSQTIRPSAAPLSALLKNASRLDVAHQLLMQLLIRYVEVEKEKREGGHIHGNDTTSSLVYLNFVLHLFETFGADIVSSSASTQVSSQNALQRDSGAVLAFIDFALETNRREFSSATGPDANCKVVQDPDGGEELRSPVPTDGLDNLLDISKGISLNKGEPQPSVVSDDLVDDELLSVALSLLLALLEGDTSLKLTQSRTPYLVLIASKLPQHLDSQSEEVRALAREARLVLSVRERAARNDDGMLAEHKGKPHESKSGHATTYQEALKLLQDPILPVRAHGLVLLREMAAEGNRASSLLHIDTKKRSDPSPAPEALDPALRVAMLDIFLNAVQEEDSFLYLNAIQGLAELGVQADGSREMFRRLVGLYVGSGSARQQKLGQSEVDKRLRIGEALLQVVLRGGEAISPYISDLARPLLAALGDANLPATLRSSIISLLGTCVEACPLACASTEVSSEMASACLDLVSLETVARPQPSRRGLKVSAGAGEDDDDNEDGEPKFGAASQATAALDSATSLSTSLPQLRRAALLLLTLLTRGSRHQISAFLLPEGEHGADQSSSDPFARFPIRIHTGQPGDQDFLSLRLPNGNALPLFPTPDSTVQPVIPHRPPPILLLPPRLLDRTITIARYVAQRDTDALVRVQGTDLVEEVQALSADVVALGAVSSNHKKQ